jgi:hypothetical protein
MEMLSVQGKLACRFDLVFTLALAEATLNA